MPTGLVFVLRQYSGFVLGFASVFLTWYTHDPEAPHVMTKLWACCMLGVVALILHELRPYKVPLTKPLCPLCPAAVPRVSWQVVAMMSHVSRRPLCVQSSNESRALSSACVGPLLWCPESSSAAACAHVLTGRGLLRPEPLPHMSRSRVAPVVLAHDAPRSALRAIIPMR